MRERARKSTLACQRTSAATRDLTISPPTKGMPVWTARADRQRRPAIVVVGVTSHQGERESRSQGQGLEVMAFKPM